MSGQCILIVDGDPKNLQILKENLEASGFQVITATDGLKAWEEIKKRCPDIILSEMTLPELDGLQLLERLRADAKTTSIPLIFLTNQTEVEQRVKALRMGAKDYLVKPLHVKEVIAHLRMVLRRLERRKSESMGACLKFAGKLEELSVADLIESFGMERKTGVLTVNNGNNKTGQIYFREGAVVNATLGDLRLEQAIYQMLPWEKGYFNMVFKEVDVTDEIAVSNLGLLLQGIKRMEEREKLLKKLPSPKTRFVLTPTFKKILEKKMVNEEVKKFISLFDGQRDVLKIIDDSHYDDLKTLERIVRLYEQGFLKPVTPVEPDEEEFVPEPTPSKIKISTRPHHVPSLEEEPKTVDEETQPREEEPTPPIKETQPYYEEELTSPVEETQLREEEPTSPVEETQPHEEAPTPPVEEMLPHEQEPTLPVEETVSREKELTPFMEEMPPHEEEPISFPEETPSHREEEQPVPTARKPEIPEEKPTVSIHEPLAQMVLRKTHVIIIGSDGSGKDELVKLLTGNSFQSKTLEQLNSLKVEFGKLPVEGYKSLSIFGVPMEKHFTPLLDYLHSNLLGYILVLDSTQPETWPYIQYLISSLWEKYQLPYCLAVTRLQQDGAASLEVIRHRLNLSDETTSLIPCNVEDKSSIKNLLLSLIKQQKEAERGESEELKKKAITAETRAEEVPV